MHINDLVLAPNLACNFLKIISRWRVPKASNLSVNIFTQSFNFFWAYDAAKTNNAVSFKGFDIILGKLSGD